MTRSLGDFYAHHHGVTHEPELRTLSLRALVERRVPFTHLYLASDGVWDLWGFDEFAERLLPSERPVVQPRPAEAADATAARMRARHAEVIEETRAKGESWYGEAADNLTGVWLCMPNPPPSASSSVPPSPVARATAPSPSRRPAAVAPMGSMSVAAATGDVVTSEYATSALPSSVLPTVPPPSATTSRGSPVPPSPVREAEEVINAALMLGEGTSPIGEPPHSTAAFDAPGRSPAPQGTLKARPSSPTTSPRQLDAPGTQGGIAAASTAREQPSEFVGGVRAYAMRLDRGEGAAKR